MKFALCSEVFQTPIEETVRQVSEIGFDGIEIAPFNVSDSVEDVSKERRAAMRKTAEDAGIEIVGLHWLLVSPAGLHITTPDDRHRERSWDYVKSLTHFCADLGGKVMILGSPKQRNLVEGDSLDAAHERVIPHLRSVADVCGERNVKLLLEALDAEQTDFMSTVDEVIELLHRVDHPQVGYMLDTRAMSHMPGGVLGNIERYGQGAGHFHTNQPDGRGPGMGDFDFGPVLAALRDVHYLNWVSCEPFDYTPDSVTVARTALQTLRAAAPVSGRGA